MNLKIDDFSCASRKSPPVISEWGLLCGWERWVRGEFGRGEGGTIWGEGEEEKEEEEVIGCTSSVLADAAFCACVRLRAPYVRVPLAVRSLIKSSCEPHVRLFPSVLFVKSRRFG